MDERFFMHRFYSTRLAAIVGMVLMAGWFLYGLWFNDVIQWDLFVILMAMAVTKVAAMLYYRYTH
jgi:hypothetical protein